MRNVTLNSALVLLLTASPASAQLSDKDVQEAIVLGRANMLDDLTYRCTAKIESKTGAFLGGGLIGLAIAAGSGSSKIAFTVTMVGNRGRIAVAARDAARRDQPLTVADIPADWRLRSFAAVVAPKFPDATSTDAPPIPAEVSDLMFRAPTGKLVMLRPTGPVESAPMVWKNAAGATVEYAELTATFNPDKILTIDKERIAFQNPAAADEGIDFVVVTSAGERPCARVPMRKLRGLVK